MKREQVLPHVMADMAARIAKGADEYGEPLTTNNGRNALQDAYEEALDLAVYLKQAIMERAASTYPIVLCGNEKLEVKPADWPGPDWSQAPKGWDWWAVDENGKPFWHASQPGLVVGSWMNDGPINSRYRYADHFNYPGHWRDSLRKRPE